jgi:flagellar hook assembly protein FlgD
VFVRCYFQKDVNFCVYDAGGSLIKSHFGRDGKFTWDGRGNKGERVKPGIYIIKGSIK